LTRLPTVGPDCKLEEKACRKLVRLVEPPVPPKSVTSVLKLDCRLLSALFGLEESPDELASDWTKLLTSLTSCEAGLPEHEELEELDVAVPESVELESDCALSAAIRLCMNA
jgi:hypothetical protein